jgi:hypothetical protein
MLLRLHIRLRGLVARNGRSFRALGFRYPLRLRFAENRDYKTLGDQNCKNISHQTAHLAISGSLIEVLTRKRPDANVQRCLYQITRTNAKGRAFISEKREL